MDSSRTTISQKENIYEIQRSYYLLNAKFALPLTCLSFSKQLISSRKTIIALSPVSSSKKGSFPPLLLFPPPFTFWLVFLLPPKPLLLRYPSSSSSSFPPLQMCPAATTNVREEERERLTDELSKKKLFSSGRERTRVKMFRKRLEKKQNILNKENAAKSRIFKCVSLSIFCLSWDGHAHRSVTTTTSLSLSRFVWYARPPATSMEIKAARYFGKRRGGERGEEGQTAWKT